jgi:hypothetical protein
VIREVPKEDTTGITGHKLMWDSGRENGVTCTSKDAKVVVGTECCQKRQSGV